MQTVIPNHFRFRSSLKSKIIFETEADSLQLYHLLLLQYTLWKFRLKLKEYVVGIKLASDDLKNYLLFV